MDDRHFCVYTFPMNFVLFDLDDWISLIENSGKLGLGLLAILFASTPVARLHRLCIRPAPATRAGQSPTCEDANHSSDRSDRHLPRKKASGLQDLRPLQLCLFSDLAAPSSVEIRSPPSSSGEIKSNTRLAQKLLSSRSILIVSLYNVNSLLTKLKIKTTHNCIITDLCD